jgi:hypothetical protein
MDSSNHWRKESFSLLLLKSSTYHRERKRHGGINKIVSMNHGLAPHSSPLTIGALEVSGWSWWWDNALCNQWNRHGQIVCIQDMRCKNGNELNRISLTSVLSLVLPASIWVKKKPLTIVSSSPVLPRKREASRRKMRREYRGKVNLDWCSSSTLSCATYLSE